jgi:hypothetical protein
VGNDVNNLYEEIEHLVGHFVRNDVDTLHENKIHLVEFSFIRVYDISKAINKNKNFNIPIVDKLYFAAT